MDEIIKILSELEELAKKQNPLTLILDIANEIIEVNIETIGINDQVKIELKAIYKAFENYKTPLEIWLTKMNNLIWQKN